MRYASPIKQKLLPKLITPSVLTQMLKINSTSTWTTAEQEEIAIKDMKLSHLKNSIAFCRKRKMLGEMQVLKLELLRRELM